MKWSLTLWHLESGFNDFHMNYYCFSSYPSKTLCASRRVPLWLSCLLLRVASTIHPDCGVWLPASAVHSHLSLLPSLQLLAYSSNKVTRRTELLFKTSRSSDGGHYTARNVLHEPTLTVPGAALASLIIFSWVSRCVSRNPSGSKLCAWNCSAKWQAKQQSCLCLWALMRFSLNKLVSVLSVFIYINFSRKKTRKKTHYASGKHCGQNSAKKHTAHISHGTHWNPAMHHIDIVSEQINFLWMCIIACIAPDVPKLWEFCRSALFLITSAGCELAVRSVSESWWIKSEGMREKRTKRQRYILHYIFKRAQRKKASRADANDHSQSQTLWNLPGWHPQLQSSNFYRKESLFILLSRVWGGMTYQMRWPLCHQDSPLNPQKSLVFDFNNEEPPLTHTQEHS